MRKIIAGFAVAMLVMFALTGCETDNKTLLTDGVWTFTNLTTDSEDETISGLITLAKILMTDVTMEFQDGGTYIMSSPLADQPTTGDWQLVGEDQLILEPDGEAVSTNNIETLSKSELIYIETFVDDQLNSYTVTTSWSR
jgi:hypothetical protein